MDRYYDIILGLIPLALFGVTAVLVAAGFGVTTAAPVGAMFSVGLMAHAMFIRAPVDTSVRAESSPAIQSEPQTESGSTPAAPFEAAD